MENRFDAVNKVYIPYVKKHLPGKLLQNILVTGGLSSPGWYPEIERHKFLTYENIFHYELFDHNIDYDEVIKDNIFFPKNCIESVNLIYADPSPGKNPIKDGIEKILDVGFVNNKLGMLVFLYFDGIGIEPFLDKQYGEYKSKDFFSTMIFWDDGHGESNQRLDGVVFYE
jgi:hypothetical protein